MNKKRLFIFILSSVLLLSVFAFAFVALAEGDGDAPPPFISGDLDADDGKKKNPTATPGRGVMTPNPKPTPKPTSKLTPEPIPSFYPGDHDDHEGHVVTKKASFIDDKQHTVRAYCEDCRTYFGIEITEPHTYNAQGICSGCGYACTHSWEHGSYRNDGNTETHIEVLVCTQCGQTTEGERTAHRPMFLYVKSVSATQHRETVRCNMCGLTYTLAPSAHMFDTVSYETTGNGFHAKYAACSKCGARQEGSEEIEPHVFNLRLCCESCGQSRDHDHVIDYDWRRDCRPLNEERHVVYYFCKGALGCNASLPGDIVPHTFDPVTMGCTECGYLKEGCEHHYTYKPVASEITAEKHTLIGTCTKCGKQIMKTEAHDIHLSCAYVPGDDSRQTCIVTERCSQCGYEKQYKENHVFSISDSALTPTGIAD